MSAANFKPSNDLEALIVSPRFQNEAPATQNAFLMESMHHVPTFEHGVKLLAFISENYTSYQTLIACDALIQRFGRSLPYEFAYPTKALIHALTGKDASLVHAFILHESLFNAHMRGEAGEFGYMQLMPGTARMEADNKHITDKQIADPVQNIKLGTKHIRRLLSASIRAVPGMSCI